MGLSSSALALFLFARGAFVVALASHLVATVACGLAAAAAPGCARSERWRRLLCASVLSAGMPGAGPVGSLLVLVPVWARTGRVHDVAGGVKEPSVDASEASVPANPRGARSRSQLERLLAQRSRTSRAAVRELQRAVRHPEEEVRLLAHALLERHESKIRAAIEVAARGLSSAEGPCRTATTAIRASRAGPAHSPVRAHFHALRRLAQLHWMLVDRGLVPRELNAETLARASQYARAAFALRPDGELCSLACRIACRLRDRRSAECWLKLGVRCGASGQRLARLHAEMALVFRATPRA